MLLYVVSINDPSFSPILSAKGVVISLLTSIQSFVSVSGMYSPHSLEMFSISPLQAYSFRCWFSNNSVQFFFARVLSKFFCGRSWHFLLHYVIPMIYLLFFLPEALWCCSRWPIISFCQDHVIFLLIHLTEVLCSHSSSFILLSFASLFNLSAVWNPSYPLCHSFNSSGGSVLFISSSILSFSQVHVLFLPCSTGVLPEFFLSHLVLTGVVSNSILSIKLLIHVFATFKFS